MQHRPLGRTGVRVSALCLGSMQFGWTADEQTSLAILTRAAEAGINFIDSADVYSRWVEGNPGGVAEQIIGKWLASGVVRRDQVVIATKVRGRMGDEPNDEGLSRRHIERSVEASLRRLGTDYIDLYQTHWPDPNTPIEETLLALEALIRRGVVRYLGCSNYPAWRLMHALWEADRHKLSGFLTLQPHYNLIQREEYERELEHVCSEFDLAVLAYSPLARGFLTGKYRRDQAPPADGRLGNSPELERIGAAERSWRVLTALEKTAGETGGSVSQLALAWLLGRPSITSAIIGPRNLEQLEDNLGSLQIGLSETGRERLDHASEWRQT